MTSSKRAAPRISLDVQIDSLLWPDGRQLIAQTDAAWERDLGLAEVIAPLTDGARHAAFIRKILMALSTDPAVIGWRQSVLQDFLRNPALVDQVQTLLPRFADLRQGHALLGKRTRGILLETADRLSQLDLYLSVLHDLHRALQAADVTSAALRGLQTTLRNAIDNPGFLSLQAELPALQASLSNLASLTIGINLNADLQPVAAVLLSINDRPFGESASLLERLIGIRADLNAETGIAPLHYVPADAEQRPLSPLFQDMDRLSIQIAQPVARTLARYLGQSSGPLAALEDELAFYLAGVRLSQRLNTRQVATCFAECAPISERLMVIDGLINVSLAVRSSSANSAAAALVASDVQFDAYGRIGLLTGPNSGGKTTYLQAVGLAQVLFQAGWCIPARAARISPIDTILTHFPALETRQQGRLAEEAERLREIFVRATDQSLVLLNKSLSSTTAGEALYLAQEVISGLRAIGVRGLFATHLIELVGRIEQIESAARGDSAIMSLVAGVHLTDDNRLLPTFRITRGTPLESGYAQEIARRYGISLAQILAARADKAN